MKSLAIINNDKLKKNKYISSYLKAIEENCQNNYSRASMTKEDKNCKYPKILIFKPVAEISKIKVINNVEGFVFSKISNLIDDWESKRSFKKFTTTRKVFCNKVAVPENVKMTLDEVCKTKTSIINNELPSSYRYYMPRNHFNFKK